MFLIQYYVLEDNNWVVQSTGKFANSTIWCD